MYEKTRIQKQSTLLHPASRRKTLDSQGHQVGASAAHAVLMK